MKNLRIFNYDIDYEVFERKDLAKNIRQSVGRLGSGPKSPDHCQTRGETDIRFCLVSRVSVV